MTTSAQYRSMAEPAHDIPTTDPHSRFVGGLERVLLGLVLGTALSRVVLLWRLNINWDEFYYLSFVHDYRTGRLALALQTFHVHFFQWVLGAGINEADQIIAARVAYFVLSLGSAVLLYAIARRYASRAAALFSVLCYLCYSNIIEHGMSFRADGLISFLTLAALAPVVWRPGMASAAVAGCLTAFALLVSVKMVFMVPTIVILLVLGSWGDGTRAVVRIILVYAGAVAATFTVFLLIHSAGVRGASVDQVASFSRHASRGTIGSAGLLPGWPYVINTIGQNGFVWIYLVSGVVLARSAWFLQRHSRRDSLALFALLVPLASLLFYRNSFPYFYVFVIPPVLVLCALPFDAVLERSRDSSSNQRVLVYMMAGVTWAVSLRLGMRMPDEVSQQRELLGVIHQLFPEPVPYIDRSSMVASFPKVGFFMSTWGMKDYLARDSAIFDELIRTRRPVFLIANSPALALRSADTAYAGTASYALREADVQTLRDNFVHHWGPIYVAGKRFGVDTSLRTIPISIPGTYTIATSGPIQIDGNSYGSGEYVDLASGTHRVTSLSGSDTVVLRWGYGLRDPRGQLRPRRIFVDF